MKTEKQAALWSIIYHYDIVELPLKSFTKTICGMSKDEARQLFYTKEPNGIILSINEIKIKS